MEEPGRSIERVQKLGAKLYDGSGDPEAAWLWLDRVNKVYGVMGCTGCFHCGQEGHFIWECPQLIGAETSVASLATPVPEMSVQKSTGRGFPSRGASTAAGRGGRGRGRGSAPGIQTEPRTQARVYAVTQQDANAAPDVVTGIISILDHDAYTLVDPGATHSFASKPFLDRFQIET